MLTNNIVFVLIDKEFCLISDLKSEDALSNTHYAAI